jgi:methionine synthase II (cobalamin-independent)
MIVDLVPDLSLSATAIGSVPHQSAEQACDFILRNFQDIPFWPQLPQKSFKENMYTQFVEGMPGIVIDEINQKLYFNTTENFMKELEKLYSAFLSNNLDYGAISPSFAQGLHVFLAKLEHRDKKPRFIKGQITGPISFGLLVTDCHKKPAIYSEMLRDAILKTLALKIRWQESQFKKFATTSQTIIFIDEPYLMSFGSAFISLSKEEVVASLEELLSSVQGLSGIHCCGNTDWSLITETSIDILSFDAFDYAESLALYPQSIKKFLDQGGILAWGIVPSGLPKPEQITHESTSSLIKRLESAMKLLTEKGIDKQLLVNQSLITPNCGTGSMPVELAERTLKICCEISEALNKKYNRV